MGSAGLGSVLLSRIYKRKGAQCLYLLYRLKLTAVFQSEKYLSGTLCKCTVHNCYLIPFSVASMQFSICNNAQSELTDRLSATRALFKILQTFFGKIFCNRSRVVDIFFRQNSHGRKCNQLNSKLFSALTLYCLILLPPYSLFEYMDIFP